MPGEIFGLFPSSARNSGDRTGRRQAVFPRWTRPGRMIRCSGGSLQSDVEPISCANHGANAKAAAKHRRQDAACTVGAIHPGGHLRPGSAGPEKRAGMISE